MIGNKRYKRVLSVALIILVFACQAGISYGEESQLVSLEVSSTKVEMGSSVTLTLSMDTSIEATEIGVEGLDNFNVDATSQSSSSTNINGVKSSLYQYILTLSPKAIGDYTLKAVVNDGSQVYESQSINISVVERDQSLDDESQDVFIKTVIAKDNYYFGENIVLEYDLYSRYNLSDYGFLDDLNYDEFIVDSSDKEDFESTIVTINGNKYLKQVVKKDILVPTRTGQFEIPSYKFQANLSTGDFFSRTEPRYLDTQAISLNVMALPTDNKPENFTGIVGKLDVKSSVDKTEVNYGDAVTLTVLLTGSGDLDAIGSLYDDQQKGVTIYETEKFSEENLVDLDYNESKEYEIIIVPEDVGSITLDPIELGYFDTDLNDYQVIEVPKQTITVTGIKEDVVTKSSTPATKETLLISQVNVQNTDKEDDMLTIQVNKSWLIIALIIVLGLVAILIAVKVSHPKPKDLSKKKYLKALDAASSIEMLDALLDKIVKDKTGLNFKSEYRKNIMAFFSTEEEKNLIEAIIVDIESDKVNQKQDLSEVKRKVERFIQISF